MTKTDEDWMLLEYQNKALLKENEKYKAKWLEARKHLRAANKGAERNAIMAQLLSHQKRQLFEALSSKLVETNRKNETNEATGPFKFKLEQNTDCEEKPFPNHPSCVYQDDKKQFITLDENSFYLKNGFSITTKEAVSLWRDGKAFFNQAAYCQMAATYSEMKQ
jgi:hypothetical protein